MRNLRSFTIFLGGVALIAAFLLFRISNIDLHCGANVTGFAYCHINKASTRFIEGISALLPEKLQVQIIGKVASFTPGSELKESPDALTKITDIYAKMSIDPKWAFAHSALGFAYERIPHFQVPADQYYAYIPKHNASEQFPVLIFLHGEGGNLSAYDYQLAQVADNKGFIVISPTYGNGEWDINAVQFIKDVLADAEKKFPIDPNHVTLMGYSSGGLIMSNLIPDLADSLRNVVFLSSYMELGQFTQPEVLSVMQKVNTVKVIYGTDDKHIDAANIPVKVQNLAALGVNIYYSQIPGGDHYLLFTDPDPVLADLSTLQY